MQFSQAHLAAILAFSSWGLFPIYWKVFVEVGAWDLFAHRLLWSFFTLILILGLKKKLPLLKEIWKSRKTRYMLILSAILISSNWLLYIYAVNVGKVLEASMGYFLNPLINVFMGWIILKEEIRKTQWPSILLALIAIVLIALQTNLDSFPWIAIVLSLTFALYGLIRKVVHVGALEGLTFETCIMILPIFVIWHFQPTTPASIFQEIPTWKVLVLSLSGLVTCIPLILFAFAAKRLPLRTLGFIQYLSPSLKFLCGFLLFHEPLSSAKLQAFYLIWIALGWYTTESYLFIRKNKKITPVSE